jgi:hypothetical protein
MKILGIKAPEGYEIDKDNSTFEKIVFKEVGKKYPMSVKEIEGRCWFINDKSEVSIGDPDFNWNLDQVSTKERAKAILAVTQLVELRDSWNKADGFVADWEDEDQWKYNICRDKNICKNDYSCGYSSLLFFGSSETRDKFLNQFRDLIEEAGEFIN